MKLPVRSKRNDKCSMYLFKSCRINTMQPKPLILTDLEAFSTVITLQVMYISELTNHIHEGKKLSIQVSEWLTLCDH